MWPKQADVPLLSCFLSGQFVAKTRTHLEQETQILLFTSGKWITGAVRNYLLLHSELKSFLEASSTKTTPFSKQFLRSTVFSKCHGLGGATSDDKDNEFE